MNFYVDPSSAELMEFGTKQNPYRTLSPVFSEILKHYSHSEIEANIYIKEGADLFIEDSNVYFVHLKLISIDTYSDSDDFPGMASITSIDTPQDLLSSKAGFHIIKNITVDLEVIITEGNFTESESFIIGRTGAAFEVIRTSISINNIIAKRISSSLRSGVFLYLIYLQQKTMTLSKFNLIYI